MCRHRLVMMAAHYRGVAENRGELRPLDGRDSDLAENIAAGRMAVMADDVRRVLVELTSRMHGHHLHTPAYAEYRQRSRAGGVEQCEFPRIAVFTPTRSALMHVVAVAAGTDIGTTGNNEAVEARDHIVSIACRIGRRRQQDRNSSHGLDRLGIRGGQHIGLFVPDSPARLLPICRHTNDRSHSGVTYAPEMPPSTRKVDAVMKLDSSEARNSTALAISSGSANRPSGTWTNRRAARSGSLANKSCNKGVLTGPGHSALTRTP